MLRDKEISLFFSVVIIFCFSFTCSADSLDTSIISPNLYVAPDGDDYVIFDTGSGLYSFKVTGTWSETTK